MTDDDSAGANACLCIYPSVRHLLCRWHFDRAWQRKLYHLVRKEEHRAEMYACLWMLIAEQDINKFLELQCLFVSYWEEKEHQFLTYYLKEYSNRTEKWAMCHRVFDHQDVDTNMLVESFHSKLKTNPRYLNHHVNRRCDDLVEVLLKFEVDQFYDRMRKEVMLTPQHASTKVDGEERHTQGEAIPDVSIKMISEAMFQVESSEKDKFYNVHILSNSCAQQPNCVPHCQDPTCLYLCCYMMKCTCIDYTQGHLCKHVHKVNTLLKHSSTAVDDDMDCNPYPTDNSCLSDLDQVDSTVKETINRPVKRPSSDTAGKKREILHYVDEITFAVNNIEDTNVLDRMLSLLMQAASSSKVCTREETSQTFTIKDKFAPAQKNETQLRFKKTCADPGRKTKASTMSCPTNEQKSTLLVNMKKSQDKGSDAKTPRSDTRTPCSDARKEATDNSIIVESYHNKPKIAMQCEKKRKRCGSCEDQAKKSKLVYSENAVNCVNYHHNHRPVHNGATFICPLSPVTNLQPMT
ncbi:uncharacterized protein [Dysidea avara]|uniref:uncharacterized protein isoform X2 n=1 Tax=Dysidea avara TaxID=196820 RepID=UPI00332EC49C